jgi:hypothetical protein
MANQFIQKTGEVCNYHQEVFNDVIVSAVWSVESGQATLDDQSDSFSSSPATTQIGFTATVPGMYFLKCVIMGASGQVLIPEVRIQVVSQGFK